MKVKSKTAKGIRFIYMTDAKAPGGMTDGDDVLFYPYCDRFEELTPEILGDFLKLKGWTFNECYWINAEDVQYYCHEPFWFDVDQEKFILEEYRKLKAAAE